MAKTPLPENEKWGSLVKRINASAQPPPELPVTDEEAVGKRGRGIVLVGDIMDFSEDTFEAKDQRELMTNLWKWLNKKRDFRGWELQLDSTLDGAIVVFDVSKGNGRGNIEHDALDFAREWIDYLSDGADVKSLKGSKLGFRIGIDDGHYEVYNANGSKSGITDKIVGQGPNDADRLTRLGGKRDIVVSEGFVDALTKQSRRNPDEWDLKFFPTLAYQKGQKKGKKQDPLQAFPKANRAQEFRLFTAHEPGRKVKMPLILQEMQEARDQINLTLKDVSEFFWELLFEAAGQKMANLPDDSPLLDLWNDLLDNAKASLRVSLFLPNPLEPDTSLACSQFRVMDPRLEKKSKRATDKQSATIYSIQNKGCGVAGRAFVSRKASVLHALPDPEADWLGYVKKLESVGLTEENILKFSRHARCFLCFPCSLKKSLKPEGTVCIDLLTSLDSFSQKELEKIAETIQESLGLLLCLLIRTRR